MDIGCFYIGAIFRSLPKVYRIQVLLWLTSLPINWTEIGTPNREAQEIQQEYLPTWVLMFRLYVYYILRGSLNPKP